MRIKITQCPNREWYRTLVGQVLKVEMVEFVHSKDQGLPEHVYWCKEGPKAHVINWVRFSDAEVVEGLIQTAEEECRPSYEALRKMEKHGGSFASRLAVLYTYADSVNRGKLVEAFSDIFSMYEDFKTGE